MYLYHLSYTTKLVLEVLMTNQPFLPIFIGWNVDFNLPEFEESTDASDLNTITASLPTPTATSTSPAAISQPATTTVTVCLPTAAHSNKVCKSSSTLSLAPFNLQMNKMFT